MGSRCVLRQFQARLWPDEPSRPSPEKWNRFHFSEHFQKSVKNLHNLEELTLGHSGTPLIFLKKKKDLVTSLS